MKKSCTLFILFYFIFKLVQEIDILTKQVDAILQPILMDKKQLSLW